uniref:Scaffold protein involved in DNA repair n=1 Tax=Cairina moschata TaxID=8855 RepID=A0A8C3BG12_CAIMO
MKRSIISKRKRFWNAECTSFPDKTPLQLKKSNVRTSVASTSISNAWLRCGDGFQSTSVLEKKYFCMFSLDEPEFIDWEKDSDSTDKFDGSEKDDSSLEISDSDSCTNLNSPPVKEENDELYKMTPTQISEYSSDNDSMEEVEMETANPGLTKKLQSSLALIMGEVPTRPASDWLKSAQALLQTPKKQSGKASRTPEDSAKKKKLLRGGLAERLCRLQNRERSAISFWRHQYISDAKIPSDKSGVLIVKILEMFEECMIQVAICQQLEQSPAMTSSEDLVIRRDEPILKVLFARETAAHLKSRPQDVACAPQIHNNCDSKEHPIALSAVNDSLLEMVESQGAVGWREVQVRVVIQRVYCLPAREGFRSQIQGNKPVCATPMVNPEPLNVRLCLLVQDAYGMFSEVQLQSLSSAEDIEQYCRRWEGKFCCLAGMKILQRTTRGRALGLFSLIDSLWPPAVPVKVPGQSQDPEMMTTNLPPPSFCYILTVQSGEIHVEVDEEEQISNLYQPPAVHGLKEILQIDGCNERCSFWARVLYLRLIPTNQREILLFVTDFTLQDVAHTIPKVVAVSVAASCVLSTEIIEALSAASRLIFFKDALWGNGKIICVERTVLLLQKPLLCSAAGADLSELPGPVKLDELDSATQANSICAVRGTIVGVNESTAFSWPTCDRCGNGKLELYPRDRGLLYCNQCSEVVVSPVLKMQLEVFLSCPSRSQSTVKVKLLQRTISSLLKSAASEDGSYEVRSVLGKEVGLLCCYVHSASSQPNCVGLEEIALLEAARN